MRGGSLASDSVVSLVDSKTYDQMNAMFDNKVGGCSCRRSKQHRGGNNSMASLMGSSTLEAFSANVRQPEMFVNSGSTGMLPPGMNASKKSSAVNASKTANASKATNAIKMANAAKMGNAAKMSANAAKAPVNASKVAMNAAKMNSVIKSFNVAKTANASMNASKAANAMKNSMGINVSKMYANAAKSYANVGMPEKSGGMNSTLYDMMKSNSGQGMNVRHKQMGGENIIGQRANILNTQHSPRQFESNAATMKFLGNEAITGPQLINKMTQYGSTSDLRTQPFSFSAAAQKAGALKIKSLKDSTVKELKKYAKKPCEYRKTTKSAPKGKKK